MYYIKTDNITHNLCKKYHFQNNIQSNKIKKIMTKRDYM